MKSIINLLVLMCGLLLTTLAFAESPRAQLQQMVKVVQRYPDYDELREKIIALAATLRPAPAIPEEAERRMAYGTATFQSAKSIADYEEAANEFEQATRRNSSRNLTPRPANNTGYLARRNGNMPAMRTWSRCSAAAIMRTVWGGIGTTATTDRTRSVASNPMLGACTT